MKKYLLLFTIWFAGMVTAMAAPVDPEQARTIAESTLRMTRGASVSSLTLVHTRLSDSRSARTAQQPLYYVFNLSGNGGMVVVSGDDRLRPVLARTERGGYDEATLPPAVRWWMDAAAEAVEAVVASPDLSARLLSRRDTLPEQVEPLLKTQWSQSAPYNLLCPEDTVCGGQSLSGCVATVVAQVLYYWRYPERVDGTVSYTTQTHGLSITEDLADYPLDYDVMEPVYTGQESETSRQAVARLMYVCGLVCEMDYCAQSSGTFPYRTHMVDGLGFDKGCRALLREACTTSEWAATLRGELAAGRPVIYGAYTVNDSGHQFVCDGYDADGLFHFNWGWGGSYDGWYDFDLLDPYGDPMLRFDCEQVILVGVQPECGTTEAPNDASLYYSGLLNDGPSAFSRDDTLRLRLPECVIYDAPLEGELRIELLDSTGRTIGPLVHDPFSLSYYYRGYFWENFVLPDSLSDGTYYLRVAFYDLAGQRREIHPAKGAREPSYLVMTLAGDSVRLAYPKPASCVLRMDSVEHVSGQVCEGASVKVNITLRNEGDYFADNVCVRSRATGEQLYSIYLPLEAGGTGLINAQFTLGDSPETDVYEVYIPSEGYGDLVVDTFSLVPAQVVLEGITSTKDHLVYGDSCIVTFSFGNTGGFYDGFVSCELELVGYDSFDTQDYLQIKSGEREDVSLGVDLKDLMDFYEIREAELRFRVAYWSEAEKEYIYFDDVLVITVSDSSTGISRPAESMGTPSEVYTLDGRRVNADVADLPPGLYIVSGKVRVVK